MEESSFWNGSPKNMFYMGLSIGIGASAVAALLVVILFMWSGKSIGSADLGANTQQNGQQQQAPEEDPNAAPSVNVKPVDGARDHILGKKDAKVTLIEYSDFECPFCARHVPTLKQILKEFPNDVRVVFRHFPLTSIHPLAKKASEASECVAKLGGENKFWQFHDEMFASQTAASGRIADEAQIMAVVKKIGVSESGVKNCLTSGQMSARVEEDMASGNDIGVRGTPANIINGLLVSGAYPFEDFTDNSGKTVKGLKTRLTDAGAKN